jgi:hypothetical protein
MLALDWQSRRVPEPADIPCTVAGTVVFGEQALLPACFFIFGERVHCPTPSTKSFAQAF